MRGTKSKEKFSQELEMSRSNYSRIESGKSDPTIKTLEQIAKLTNSNASSGFNPKWANRTRTRNRTSNIGVRNGRRKSNDFVWIMHEIIAYFLKSDILDITKQRTE